MVGEVVVVSVVVVVTPLLVVQCGERILFYESSVEFLVVLVVAIRGVQVMKTFAVRTMYICMYTCEAYPMLTQMDLGLNSKSSWLEEEWWGSSSQRIVTGPSK